MQTTGLDNHLVTHVCFIINIDGTGGTMNTLLANLLIHEQVTGAAPMAPPADVGHRRTDLHVLITNAS